ncbi:hypothetical protein CYMTET_26270, partial [Cymbomonas tetramitiformis]
LAAIGALDAWLHGVCVPGLKGVRREEGRLAAIGALAAWLHGVVKAVWTHVKAHGCSERNYIVCDDTLKGLFKKPKFKMFHLSRHLKPHFPPKGVAPKVPKKKERRAMPSTRSARDSESAGDASLRFKKMSRPVGGKVEYAAFTERNLKMLCLRRSQLEVLLDNPEFDMIIRGLYVRIRVKDVYRVVKVEHSLTGNNEYLCGHKETSKLLEVKNMQSYEPIRLDAVSNQDFTKEECDRLRTAVVEYGVYPKVPKSEWVDQAMRVLEAFPTESFDTVRQRLVNLRERASVMGDYHKHRRLKDQLEELDKTGIAPRNIPIPEVDVEPPEPTSLRRAIAASTGRAAEPRAPDNESRFSRPWMHSSDKGKGAGGGNRTFGNFSNSGHDRRPGQARPGDLFHSLVSTYMATHDLPGHTHSVPAGMYLEMTEAEP